MTCRVCGAQSKVRHGAQGRGTSCPDLRVALLKCTLDLEMVILNEISQRKTNTI